jgi:hypothetical protein
MSTVQYRKCDQCRKERLEAHCVGWWRLLPPSGELDDVIDLCTLACVETWSLSRHLGVGEAFRPVQTRGIHQCSDDRGSGLLREVASIYRQEGGAPTVRVQKEMDTSHRNAGRWVATARERGFLPSRLQSDGSPVPFLSQSSSDPANLPGGVR